MLRYLTPSPLLRPVHPRARDLLPRCVRLKNLGRVGPMCPPRDWVQLFGLHRGVARRHCARPDLQGHWNPLPRHAVRLPGLRARHCVSERGVSVLSQQHVLYPHGHGQRRGRQFSALHRAEPGSIVYR